MACRVAVKIIACFCGCSELELKQIKKLTTCTTRELLDNPEARRLLSQYIKYELDDEDDNLTLKYLRMYEISLEFVQNPQRDHLALCAIRERMNDIDCYPNETVEKQVKTAFRMGNLDTVYDSLLRLQRDLEVEIDGSFELRGMRAKLLTKIDAVFEDKSEKRK